MAKVASIATATSNSLMPPSFPPLGPRNIPLNQVPELDLEQTKTNALNTVFEIESGKDSSWSGPLPHPKNLARAKGLSGGSH
jgi:hypothetical protein